MNVLFQSWQVRVFDPRSGSTRKESMWRWNNCCNLDTSQIMERQLLLTGKIIWVSSLKKAIGKITLQPQRDYTIPRVPLCLSPHPNWVRPPPLPQASVPPPEPKGGGATHAFGWGGGRAQFGRLERKPGTLSTLCLQPFQLKNAAASGRSQAPQ